MKKTLIILAASTALTAAIGVPASRAMQVHDDGSLRPMAALFDGEPQALPLFLASDDDGADRRWWDAARRDRDDDRDDGNDEDDDNEEDEDEDEDDEDEDRSSGTPNPAPAGTVAPQQNGLFGTGAPPQVQVN